MLRPVGLGCPSACQRATGDLLSLHLPIPEASVSAPGLASLHGHLL